tara:strand:- start:54190 stop:54726 length:537 start_codon:yes stop_codon:yes gene_type:complete
MRIACAGSHRVGKSTLVSALAEQLAKHSIVDEPYYVLEEDGYEFSNPPLLEDFEAQLERSILETLEGSPNVVFDRCPADILAYLRRHDDAAHFDFDEGCERSREAMQTLDLVVVVPIEDDDRIAVHHDQEFRLAVDEEVHRLLVDDEVGFGVDVVVVSGDAETRLAQVLAHIRNHHDV